MNQNYLWKLYDSLFNQYFYNLLLFHERTRKIYNKYIFIGIVKNMFHNACINDRKTCQCIRFSIYQDLYIGCGNLKNIYDNAIMWLIFCTMAAGAQ